MEDTRETSPVGRELTSGWKYDPDLVGVNEQRSPPAEYVSEREMQIVWRNLMSYLCSRHRTNRRNGRPTDYNIEELRRDHYEGGFPDAYYFRRLISWVAKQHREIEVDRDVIRLTRFGFDNCEKYDPTFQMDIEY